MTQVTQLLERMHAGDAAAHRGKSRSASFVRNDRAADFDRPNLRGGTACALVPCLCRRYRQIGLTRAGALQPGVGSDDTHLPFVVTEFDRTAGLGWRLPPTVSRQSPHTRPIQAPANGRCAPTAPRVARAVPRESSASRALHGQRKPALRILKRS
jgi:hypothetical protein